jgi:hypothetical protein
MRELREKLAEYLESSVPIEVTRHGQTIGFYMPVPKRPARSERRVIDADILIRAVMGQRARGLIANATDQVAFCVAEANYEEAKHDLAQLAPTRGIDEPIWQSGLDTVMAAIQLMGQEELALAETVAKARIARRDERDWPAVASGSGRWSSRRGSATEQVTGDGWPPQPAATLTGPCGRSSGYCVPPTVRPSMRSVGWPTPTGTL